MLDNDDDDATTLAQWAFPNDENILESTAVLIQEYTKYQNLSSLEVQEKQALLERRIIRKFPDAPDISSYWE